MCYVPRAEGPFSDHALLLGDVGDLRSGLVDSDGGVTSIADLKGWRPVIATEVPWKRFFKKSEPMRSKGTGGVLSEEGASMLDDFREMVDSEAGELGIKPDNLLGVLSAATDAAERGLANAGGDYEAWAASGGVENLQACVDEVIPDFLDVVQGSIERFVGKADRSEQERREQLELQLKTMGELQEGLKRMNHLRREMLRTGVSAPGTAGAVDAETAERVRGAIGRVAESFATLESLVGEGEALPSSLDILLAKGRSEISAILEDGGDEVPDFSGPEFGDDSLWSFKGRCVYRARLRRAVVKVKRERFKEFSTRRYEDFSEGRAGVWFQKSKERTTQVLNQMPVGGGVGLAGGLAAFQEEYEEMFDVSYEKDPHVTGPTGSKYEGRRLGQLKHILRRMKCGKVELKTVEDTISDMKADGVDDPEVLDVTSKVLTGLLAHMDQVKEGMDASKLLGRLSPSEREMVLKGGSKHPGKDGVKRVFMQCFGGDLEELFVSMVEIGVMFGVQGRKMCEELMYLAAKPTGGFRPLTCQNELHKAIDEVLARRMFVAYCGVARIPAGQVIPAKRVAGARGGTAV